MRSGVSVSILPLPADSFHAPATSPLATMSTSDRDRWNDKYSRHQPVTDIEADDWLVRSWGTIQESATARSSDPRAVDIACGLGHNSIWMAQQGLRVDGVDISETGLGLARQTAERTACSVNWLEADLDEWSPCPETYDLAIVFRFLDRKSVPRIVQAGLRSGGWLVYETFAAKELERPGSHIHNPAFTLAPGELPTLFRDFDVIEFREDTLDDRFVQRLLARRR